VTDVEKYIPWWLDCNKNRYPYWYGNREPRVENLFEALMMPEKYSMDKFLFFNY